MTGLARAIIVVCSWAAVGLLGACSEERGIAPPEVAYGTAACVVCGMIVSEERSACATIVQQPDGTLESLDRFRILGHADRWEAPQTLRRIPSRMTRDVAHQLCSRLGPAADVRVVSRISTRKGWVEQFDGSERLWVRWPAADLRARVTSSGAPILTDDHAPVARLLAQHFGAPLDAP